MATTSAKKTSAAKSSPTKDAATKSKASASLSKKPGKTPPPAKGSKITVKTATKKSGSKPAAKMAQPAAPKASTKTAAKPAATPAAAKKAAPKSAPKPAAAEKAPVKSAAVEPPPGPTSEPGKPGKVSPPPRLTVRTPVGADELKQKIGALATATAQIRNLKRGIQKSFFEIGLILKDIDDRKLYEVKGYGSFEAFLEREIDLGKQLGLRLSRAVEIFQRDAAVQAGLERVSAAIAVFDGEVDPNAAPPATTPTSSGGHRSPIPFHKQ